MGMMTVEEMRESLKTRIAGVEEALEEALDRDDQYRIDEHRSQLYHLNRRLEALGTRQGGRDGASS